ncbi:MAG: zf-TFIIB domain-containing protein [Betaproteobacteria bacterium]|nr:zf-TFIIB domain-containing protein [Betaproteobacteria bacterium]
MTKLLRCPNCSETMERRSLERTDGAELAIDLCFCCHVFWFDSMESPRLAAGAVMELLRRIRQHGQTPRHILREQLDCPRCGALLVCTHDLVKGGRIRYYRCSHDGGRLTPFLQFLIEKQFVRVVTPHELSRLRLDIRQARCSGCGAPIDLVRQDHCGHCFAPITVLDADALERASHSWNERAHARANGPAKAEQDLVRLRDIERWQCKDDSDLLLRSIEIAGE